MDNFEPQESIIVMADKKYNLPDQEVGVSALDTTINLTVEQLQAITTNVQVSAVGVHVIEVVVQEDQSSLSSEQKEKLFAELKTIFDFKNPVECTEEEKFPETCSAAKEIGWDTIRSVLDKNPEQMQYLQKMIAARFRPTIYAVTQQEYLFGDQRNYDAVNPTNKSNINSVGQDRTRFNGLTDAEKQAAVQIAIARSSKEWGQYSDEENQTLRGKFYEYFNEIPKGCGIDFWRSLILTSHFGGRPYTYEELNNSAQTNGQLCDNSWQWRNGKDLREVFRSDVAHGGRRYYGRADRNEDFADYRNHSQGVCVGGLRVPCS
ncbi:hypothetical protein KJ652_07025 [Patescibacteria group bacterium]|nr:hypothetical protein [Patescibacteria group bacterium]MBU1124301.1 hypothetical protein [Patescibacteria group bacterium]